VSSANLMIELEAFVATQSWVNRKSRRDSVAQGGVKTQGLQLDDELGGYYDVEG
jgi:hypothetical protein